MKFKRGSKFKIEHNKKVFMWIVILLVVLVVLIFIKRENNKEREPTQLPNPAAVYCLEQNGTLEIRENEMGQYGVCIFSDGSECDEWAFYRGECEKGENFP